MISLVASTTAFNISWSWYVIRGAGLVAVLLMFLVMSSGIGMVTGFTYRIIEPLKAWVLHRALSLALLGAVLVHVSALLIDKFIHYRLVDITVPFMGGQEHSKLLGLNVGSLYTALGILAAYILIVVVASSLLLLERKGPAWKWLHYLSYVAAVMVFFHTLFLGTDFKHGLARIAWLGMGVVLVLGIASRLHRAGTLRESEEQND